MQITNTEINYTHSIEIENEDLKILAMIIERADVCKNFHKVTEVTIDEVNVVRNKFALLAREAERVARDLSDY